MSFSSAVAAARFNRGRLACAAAVLLLWGCAGVIGEPEAMKDTGTTYPVGTIISTETGRRISFETLMDELADTEIVYVGEQHTSAAHHEIQLRIIAAMLQEHPDTAVGMEMFDRTYQPVLDRWSAGEFDEQSFIEKVHWYANWRFDFALYRDILLTIKDNRIRLIGLNLPFHIPPKIAAGGIDTLAPWDRQNIAQSIDTSDTDHRSYIQDIYSHHKAHTRSNFEYFYTAQCAWEDTMAESVALNSGRGKMIVLAGNGHIFRKFGIPDRAFRRNNKPFKTIYLEKTGNRIEPDAADYIWVTE